MRMRRVDLSMRTEGIKAFSKRIRRWMNERMNERTNARTHERTHARTNKRTNERTNERTCIYIPHISHGVPRRFTILTWVRSDVSMLRRLWLPLWVHIWSHSPTQPMHEMYNETMKLQIDHNTGNYVPYSFRQVCRFFNAPCWPCNTEDAGDGAYGL